MRILFTIGQLGLGGAERQLLILAKALAERGDQVAVAVFHDNTSWAAEALWPTFKLIRLEGSSFLGKLVRLWRLIGNEKPDLVHGYLTVGNIASLVAHFRRSRPAVVWGGRASQMRLSCYPLKWRLASALEYSLVRFADLVIVNSHAGYQHWLDRGALTERLAIVENGIDLAHFRADEARRRRTRQSWGIDEECTVIGHVARIDPMKDHYTFFAALAQLAKRGRHFRAVAIAVGSEEERQRLRTEAIRLGCADHVIITPALDDIANAYAGFDLFCSSSAWGEGFSNVIGEALASGLPVVATDVGDARRVIGDAGVCVAPGNAAALATALERVMDNRQTLSERARERVIPYSIEALAARTARWFEEIIRCR